MSKLLTVTQTIELLESLKGAVRDFAATEEKLTRDFKTKSEAAQKRFSEDTSAHDAEIVARLGEAETTFQSSTQAWQSKREQRKARIARANKASRKTALERIDNEEGRRKYQSQKGLLDTKRFRTDSLAQNDATLAEFNQQLGENRAAFVELEQKAKVAFRGYGKLRRMVDSASVLPNTNFSADEYQSLEQLRQLHTRTNGDLGQFDHLLLPKIFRLLPLWLWVVLILVCAGASVPAFRAAGQASISYPMVGGAAAALLAVVLRRLFCRTEQGRRAGDDGVQRIGNGAAAARLGPRKIAATPRAGDPADRSGSEYAHGFIQRELADGDAGGRGGARRLAGKDRGKGATRRRAS